MLVLVRVGLLHAVELDNVPVVNEEYNLRSEFIKDGKFRVVEVGTRELDGEEFPCILIARIGDVPSGEYVLPMGSMNI